MEALRMTRVGDMSVSVAARAMSIEVQSVVRRSKGLKGGFVIHGF
jgi:hypothetical protein